MISIGALDEAISDIFGALVDAFIGKNDEDIWLCGEDITTPGGVVGDASRYMCDPAKDNASRDYYPDRYLGEEDNGGVHWNSGIANLGECVRMAHVHVCE